MRDTTPEMALRYRRALMSQTPQERLRQCCSMHQMAKALVLASLKAQLGDEVSDQALRCALFKRFYGADFGADERDRILAWLAKTS